jgi:antitoxin (DNA-binding transcriptional repressor) of toxin-antitoxin stability system
MTVTVQEAQAQLPKLIEQAASGEDVIIADDSATPMRLTPVAAGFPKRRLGLMEGVYTVPDDINTPFEKEIDKIFYGDTEGE